MNGDDFFGPMAGAFILAAVAGAVIFLTPFAAGGLLIFAGWHVYKNNPARKERLARERTMALYRQATQQLLPGRQADLESELCYHLPGNTPESVREQLLDIGYELIAQENIIRDVPEPPAVCDSVEGGRYRDMLIRITQSKQDPVMTQQAARAISLSLAYVAQHAPPIESELSVPVVAAMDNLSVAVDELIDPFWLEDNDYGHFKKLKDRINANYRATHRTNPIHPRDYKGDDAPQVYLKGTPLLRLFDVRIPFAIPEATRFEHMYILGGTGSGKTTAMKRLIANDLDDVKHGDKSVVVIDSQGDFINELLALDFPYEQIVLIDADDVEHPVSLNLFDVGQDRFADYSALEQEQLRNSIIELYEFVLASLMDTGLTGQQRVIFRYGVRLMLEVPDATLHTFLDLLEEGGKDRYQQYIDRLEEIPRRFFESQFDHNEFRRMRQAVLRRFYIILENAAFERMFRHPKSKLDLFEEMNAGKLILINTSKATLKEEGTKTFGRFFIALIAQAAAERAMISRKTPTIVYVDEAHEYLDSNVNVILAQARKQQVGLVMAHQYLDQIRDRDIRSGLEANTSIKLAGNISASDARALANQVNCDARDLQDQPTFSFMTYVRGLVNRALPVSYTPGALDRWGARLDMPELREYQRAKYAVPPHAPDPPPEDDPGPEESPPEEDLAGEGFTTRPSEPSFDDDEPNRQEFRPGSPTVDPTDDPRPKKPRKNDDDEPKPGKF